MVASLDVGVMSAVAGVVVVTSWVSVSWSKVVSSGLALTRLMPMLIVIGSKNLSGSSKNYS